MTRKQPKPSSEAVRPPELVPVPRYRGLRVLGSHRVGGVQIDFLAGEPKLDVAGSVGSAPLAMLGLRGRFFRIDRRRQLECEPGDILYWSPGEPYGVRVGSVEARALSVRILEDAPRELRQNAYERSMRFWQPGSEGVATGLRLFFEATIASQPDERRILELAARLFPPNVPVEAPIWAERMRQRLEEAAHRPMVLRELAKELQVHPSHVSRAFPKYFGMGAGEYARRVRLEKASRLLLDEDLPLREIALRSGFHDQSHFTRVFRQEIGTSPARLRRSLSRMELSNGDEDYRIS